MEDNIFYFGDSITGRRSNNEDSFLCEKINANTWLFVVADGMGGSERGEVASRLAVNTLMSYIKKSFEGEVIPSQMKELLEEGFRKAQSSIKDDIEKDPDCHGMGTTLVVLLIYNGYYVWGNIGDSRIYQIDSDGIKQISRDHTYIDEVLRKNDNNDISETQLQQYSHIITRSVSGGSDKPDLYPEDRDSLSLTSPVSFLLCSDGLISNKSDNIDGLEIYRTFIVDQEPEVFVRELIKKAFEKGSNDNITAIAIAYGKVPVLRGQKSRRKILVPVITILFAIIAFVGIFYKFQNDKIVYHSTLNKTKVPLSDSTVTKTEKQNKNDINSWEAFSSHDNIPLTKDSYINFSRFPGSAKIKNYIVFIKNSRTGIIDSVEVGLKDQGVISLEKFSLLKNGMSCKINISAVLEDGTRIPGGFIEIKIRN